MTDLPQPFTFYNETYDHVYANECGSLIFGDDNIYDDCYPSDPPIPNPTMTDPNNTIHAQWGTHFGNPHDDPAQAVYTEHVTGGGRNWFVVRGNSMRASLVGAGKAVSAWAIATKSFLRASMRAA